MEKFALVTGASGGLGQTIAKKLSTIGYSLYLQYNQNQKGIDDLTREIKQSAPNIEVIPIQADLSNYEGVSFLLCQIVHPIDTIIFNAGNSFYGLLTDMNQDDIYKMIYLHTTSPVLITKSLLPRMITNKRGSIIFITSIWGQTGASCEVVYSMVKGAQNTFVKALAKEVALSGIRVNGIAPGPIQTKMMSTFSDEDITAISEDIPMGRLGNPIEIANTVEFLQSEASSYITGQILGVNGGWYC